MTHSRGSVHLLVLKATLTMEDSLNAEDASERMKSKYHLQFFLLEITTLYVAYFLCFL